MKGLDDAQLLDLVRHLFTEASRRKLDKEFKGVAADAQQIENIKREAYQSEVNRQQQIQLDKIAEDARKQAAADVAAKFGKEAPDSKKSTVQDTWESKLAIQKALLQLGIDPNIYWSIAVWSKGDDKRIYLNDTNDKSMIEYYHTGTNKYPPGKIVCTARLDTLMSGDEKFTTAKKEQIKALFAQICKKWNSISFNANEIDDFDGIPNQRHLDAYLKAMEEAS